MNENIQELYATIYADAEEALALFPDDPVGAMSDTLATALDGLSDLYHLSTGERLLLASCALAAVHSAAHRAGYPVLVDLSPSGLLSFADKMTDLKLNTKGDDDVTDSL